MQQQSTDRKKIAFFEVEDWEVDQIRRALPEHDLRFYPHPLDLESVGEAGDAQIVSVFIRSQVARDVLDRLPAVEFITTRSTGFEHVDLRACAERGIPVSNVPHYGETTVAEHTFGLILALSRNIHRAYMRTIRGDFSLEGLKGFDLQGKTLGVVGAGSIGLHVIRIAKGFGMNVLAYDVKWNHLLAEVLGFTYATLEDLLARADIVSLHAPYMPATHHLINRDNIRLMKRGALLINTARGGLIDTAALMEALDEGIIGGAGLDVVEGEELIEEETQLLAATAVEEKLKAVLRSHLLLRRENVVITPHIAFYSQEALERIVSITVDNITSYLAGRPQNVVSSQ